MQSAHMFGKNIVQLYFVKTYFFYRNYLQKLSIDKKMRPWASYNCPQKD